MKKLALLLFCIALGLGSGWAAVNGTTDPTLFNDSVDWCVQYGCLNNYFVFPSPTGWTSQGGVTGQVGLVGTLQGFYNLQQDVTFAGNFPSNMGLVYNGALFGNTPTPIATTFDQGVYGAGAWIQSDYYGPFVATIELFDGSYQSLGTFSANGYSDYAPGTGLFIGAFDTSGLADVWAAEFSVVDQYGYDTVVLGTLKLNTVPEPTSLLLFGSSALGLAGVLRRRFKGVL